jgi:hypothetical protein
MWKDIGNVNEFVMQFKRNKKGRFTRGFLYASNIVAYMIHVYSHKLLLVVGREVRLIFSLNNVNGSKVGQIQTTTRMYVRNSAYYRWLMVLLVYTCYVHQ